MKCPKCGGQGLVCNQRYYRHSSSEAYEMGIRATKECKLCKGTGYIIGNTQDIVDRLQRAVNGVAISKDEAKQMLEAIMK